MTPRPTRAVVLAAGLGTRLRPLTLVRAKPALPVGNDPLIRRIIRWLAAQGVTDLVVNLHYLPHTITAAVGDGSDLGVGVRYSWEQPAVLGTAGGPRLAQEILGPGSFFVVNGDTLTDLSLQELWLGHSRSGALATLAVVPNEHPERYGGAVLDAHGAIERFVPRGDPSPSYHFIGVQVVEPEAYQAVQPGTAAQSVGDVFDRLISERPGSIRAHPCAARFWDIGTVGDYWTTSKALSSGNSLQQNGPSADIHPSATVRDCVVWNDVRVESGATIDQCIVTDRVVVPEGRHYHRTILLNVGEGQPAALPFAVDD